MTIETQVANLRYRNIIARGLVPRLFVIHYRERMKPVVGILATVLWQ